MLSKNIYCVHNNHDTELTGRYETTIVVTKQDAIHS